jgi:hypothetical protein
MSQLFNPEVSIKGFFRGGLGDLEFQEALDSGPT